MLPSHPFPSEEVEKTAGGYPMTEARSCPKCGAAVPAGAPGGICPKCLLQAGLGTGANDLPADARSAATVPPSAPPPNPYLENLARQFPQLEILEVLGQGGMGVVYKARQRHLNRLVAVKILPPSVGRDPAFAERFAREAQALAQLNHPNIVQVYDFGRTDEFFYFLMEYVDGVNLRALIRDGKLQPEQALKIVPQICEALQFAHDEGIVHRDIKPENILIDKKGRVKIADFGLAKLVGRPAHELSLTGTGQLMGTLGYMAPEQLQEAHTVDHRADIYSLGVVFYEMLTGRLPIGRFDPPSKKVHVDVRLDEIVLRSLESEPERRYQHASELKEQVDRLTSSPMAATAGPAPPAHAPFPNPQPWRPDAHPSDNPASDWLSQMLGMSPHATRQLVQGTAAMMGTGGTLLILAMAFGLLPSDEALFAGVACFILAGLVRRLASKIDRGSPESIVAGNAKLQAALAMSAGPQKDQTLVKIAREAAEEGEAEAIRIALNAVHDARARDEAAALCALQVAENEGADSALPVARIIQDNGLRDEVLQKLVEA
jgi:predicted Ser/Thr protein kinase